MPSVPGLPAAGLPAGLPAALPAGLPRVALPGLAGGLPKVDGPTYTGQVVDYNEEGPSGNLGISRDGIWCCDFCVIFPCLASSCGSTTYQRLPFRQLPSRMTFAPYRGQLSYGGVAIPNHSTNELETEGDFSQV